MAISRIEQLIEDIYEFVESCKMQPFSSTKVIVPKDELYDLLDELRLRTPDEIKRYQKIIANRDAIIDDAEEKAKNIVEEADSKANSLTNQHQIMQKAYDQANELVNDASVQADRILAEANYEANEIKASSLSYTEELLDNVEDIVSVTYNQSKKDYDALIKDLENTLGLIKDNKDELAISTGQDVEDQDFEDKGSEGEDSNYHDEDSLENNNEDYDDFETQDYSEAASNEDYDFDEDTFLKDIDE